MTLQFDGCAYFRQRLVLSTLSCTPIKIKNIRSQENQPGLRGRKILFQLFITILFFFK
jgi:RNA 3'-terminal phosphate cyclase